MKIEKIDIENFGKFKQLHLYMDSGLNIVQGNNESGKSTLAMFIKFILYGFSGTRLQSLQSNEKKLYMPWNGGHALGSLTITTDDGGQYRIEREAGQRDACRVIDLSTNAEVFKNEVPGEALFKCGEETFAKTAFIRQFDTPETGGERLADQIQQLLFESGDGDGVTYQDAVKKLNDARALLLSKNKSGGQIAILKQKRDELQRSMGESLAGQHELIELESQYNELSGRMDSNSKKLTELREELENYKAYDAQTELTKLDAAKKQSIALSQALEKTRERHAYGAFVPDAEYARQLTSAALDYRRRRHEFEAAYEQKRKISTLYELAKEQSSTYEAIKEYGGIDEVEQRLGHLSRGRNGFKGGMIAAVICMVAALAIGLGVLTARGAMSVYAVCFGAVVLGAVATGLCVWQWRGASGKIHRFAEQLGLPGESGLRETIAGYSENTEQIDQREAELLVASNDYARQKEEYFAFCESVFELTRRWNRTVICDIFAEPGVEIEVDAPSPPADEELMVIAREVTAADDEIGEGKALADKYETIYQTLLSSCDLAQLEKLAATARKPAREEGQIGRELDFLTKSGESLSEKEREMEKTIAVKTAKLPDPVVLESQIQILDKKIGELTLKHDAYELASVTLGQAGDELKNSIAPTLTDTSSRLFTLVTGGRYMKLNVGTDLNLSVIDASQTREVEYLSAGTQDAAFISLRFALLDLIYPGSPPPLIFDEAFARLDPARFEAMMKLLLRLAGGLQLILLTCQPEMSEMLGRTAVSNGMKYNMIKL